MSNIVIVQELLVSLVILVPLVTGLTQVFKNALGLETPRFIPLIAVGLGALGGGLLLGATVPAIVVGIIAGLSGVGLWEVGKTTVAGK